MLTIENKYYSIKARLIYESPVKDLNDSHMVKLVAHLVKSFEKERPYIKFINF